jgi:DNA-binding response OmpR family regulator
MNMASISNAREAMSRVSEKARLGRRSASIQARRSYGPLRILIVDDEPNVRLSFRIALESARYTVAEAEDGEDAVDLLRREAFDLVLLDLRMPLLDGIETLHCLRAEAIEVPVVIVSAHGDAPLIARALRLGAVDFISKPVTPATLRRRMQGVLDRRCVPSAIRPIAASRMGDGPLADVLARTKRARDLGVVGEARIVLSESNSEAKSDAEARYLSGVFSQLRGDDDAAVAEFRAALAIDPNFAPARRRLAEYGHRSPS